MAILNKDTSIGDILDVYDRLNSIQSTTPSESILDSRDLKYIGRQNTLFNEDKQNSSDTYTYLGKLPSNKGGYHIAYKNDGYGKIKIRKTSSISSISETYTQTISFTTATSGSWKNDVALDEVTGTLFIFIAFGSATATFIESAIHCYNYNGTSISSSFVQFKEIEVSSTLWYYPASTYHAKTFNFLTVKNQKLLVECYNRDTSSSVDDNDNRRSNLYICDVTTESTLTSFMNISRKDGDYIEVFEYDNLNNTNYLYYYSTGANSKSRQYYFYKVDMINKTETEIKNKSYSTPPDTYYYKDSNIIYFYEAVSNSIPNVHVYRLDASEWIDDYNDMVPFFNTGLQIITIKNILIQQTYYSSYSYTFDHRSFAGGSHGVVDGKYDFFDIKNNKYMFSFTHRAPYCDIMIDDNNYLRFKIYNTDYDDVYEFI